MKPSLNNYVFLKHTYTHKQYASGKLFSMALSYNTQIVREQENLNLKI